MVKTWIRKIINIVSLILITMLAAPVIDSVFDTDFCSNLVDYAYIFIFAIPIYIHLIKEII